MRKRSDSAYFAGVIDGDGTLCISVANAGKKEVSYKPYIAVGCTTPKMCDWAAQHYGGSLFRYTKKASTLREVFFWKIAGNKGLVDVVSQIQPFLMIKRPQADIMLEYLALGRSSNSEKRMVFARAIQSANKNHNLFPFVDRNMATDEANAYAAGLVDSEGSLKINPATRCLQPKVEISNTNRNLVVWLNSYFSGRVYTKTYESALHSNLYTWVLYEKTEIEKFLQLVRPYLAIKGEHADLVTRACQCPNSEREPIYRKLRAIQNSRARTPTTNTSNVSEETKIESALHGNVQ